MSIHPRPQFASLVEQYLSDYHGLRDEHLAARLRELGNDPQWIAEALLVYQHFRRYAADLKTDSWEFIGELPEDAPALSGPGFSIWIPGDWVSLDLDPPL